MRIARAFLLIASVVVWSTLTYAETESQSFPTSMLGSIKPGTCIGISSIDETTSVVLRTYGEENFKVVQELKLELGMSLRSAAYIAEKNAFVRDQFQQFVSRHDLPNESRDRIMIMPLIKTNFGTVIATGDDFVLVRLTDESQTKLVIPKSSIGKVFLDANPVRLYDPATGTHSGNDG